MSIIPPPPRRVHSTQSGALGPYLIRRIQSQLGPVRIANEGVPSLVNIEIGVDGSRSSRFLDFGEAYEVNCPYCHDTRKRLCINHRYGTKDPQNGVTLYIAHCFNEDCLADPANRADLKDRLLGFLNPSDRDRSLAVRPAEVADPNAPPPEIPLPDDFIPLSRLRPRHVARYYLKGRGFDPDALCRDHGVGYCRSGKVEGSRISVSNRIVIPVRLDGRLVGWQARYIGTTDWKQVPKYLLAPGMRKTRLLYGWDQARSADRLVLVEGILDAWRVGPGGVALFGKTISPAQLDLVVRWYRERGGPVLVALDGEASAEASIICTRLHQAFVPSEIVTLPPGTDPGDTPYDELQRLLQAAQEGIAL